MPTEHVYDERTRMYSHLMEAAGAPTTVRVFRDVETAKAWLLQPAGPTPAAPPA